MVDPRLIPLAVLVMLVCIPLVLDDGIPHEHVQAVTFDDNGGLSEDYEKFVAAANSSYTLVEVYGRCDSACVRKISAHRFCMGPYATFATHEARNVFAATNYDYAQGKRDEASTQAYRLSLPACARALFDARDGFASGTVVRVTGEELRAACPQLRLCDPELTYWRYVGNLWQTHAEGFRRYGVELYR